MEEKSISLFGDEFDIDSKSWYNQFKLKNDREALRFLKQFIILEEEPITPYKHKNAYYNKKSHYINGKKVNRQVYKYIKHLLEKEI